MAPAKKASAKKGQSKSKSGSKSGSKSDSNPGSNSGSKSAPERDDRSASVDSSAQSPKTPKTSRRKKDSDKEWNFTHVPPRPDERGKNGRHEGRNLITWTRPRMPEKTLLHIQYELARHKIELPWDAIAHRLHPGSSGGAILQHMNRMRNMLVAEGHLVPPICQKPGSRVKVDPMIRGFVRADMDGSDSVTTRPVRFDERMEDRRFNIPDAFDDITVPGSIKRENQGGSSRKGKTAIKKETSPDINALDGDDDYNPARSTRTSRRPSRPSKKAVSYREPELTTSDEENENSEDTENEDSGVEGFELEDQESSSGDDSSSDDHADNDDDDADADADAGSDAGSDKGQKNDGAQDEADGEDADPDAEVDLEKEFPEFTNAVLELSSNEEPMNVQPGIASSQDIQHHLEIPQVSTGTPQGNFTTPPPGNPMNNAQCKAVNTPQGNGMNTPQHFAMGNFSPSLQHQYAQAMNAHAQGQQGFVNAAQTPTGYTLNASGQPVLDMGSFLSLSSPGNANFQLGYNRQPTSSPVFHQGMNNMQMQNSNFNVGLDNHGQDMATLATVGDGASDFSQQGSTSQGQNQVSNYPCMPNTPVMDLGTLNAFLAQQQAELTPSKRQMLDDGLQGAKRRRTDTGHE